MLNQKIVTDAAIALQLTIDQQRSRDMSILEPVPGSSYQISLYRIVELLTDKNRWEDEYRLPDGRKTRVGSVTRLSELTEVSRTSYEQLSKKGAVGVYVEPDRSTYVRLTAFLNSIQPALIDPADPMRREIRFPDIQVPVLGTLQGWQVLQFVHQKSAPVAETLLPENLKISEAEQALSKLEGILPADELAALREKIKDTGEVTQYPIFIYRTEAQMRASKILDDLRRHMAQVGCFTAEDYADWLLRQKGRSSAKQKAELVSDLVALLNERKRPGMYTLSMIARFAQLDGVDYQGDVNAMLENYEVFLD